MHLEDEVVELVQKQALVLAHDSLAQGQQLGLELAGAGVGRHVAPADGHGGPVGIGSAEPGGAQPFANAQDAVVHAGEGQSSRQGPGRR